MHKIHYTPPWQREYYRRMETQTERESVCVCEREGGRERECERGEGRERAMKERGRDIPQTHMQVIKLYEDNLR